MPSASARRASQVFRPFAKSRASDRSTPTGLALDVGLGTDANPNAGRIGVALFQYEQPENLTSGQDRQARQYTSNALSMYWHQPVAGLMFSSQLSHLNLNLESQSQDALVNLNLQNQSGADTWSLENKLRYPAAGRLASASRPGCPSPVSRTNSTLRSISRCTPPTCGSVPTA